MRAAFASIANWSPSDPLNPATVISHSRRRKKHELVGVSEATVMPFDLYMAVAAHLIYSRVDRRTH